MSISNLLEQTLKNLTSSTFEFYYTDIYGEKQCFTDRHSLSFFTKSSRLVFLLDEGFKFENILACICLEAIYGNKPCTDKKDLFVVDWEVVNTETAEHTSSTNILVYPDSIFDFYYESNMFLHMQGNSLRMTVVAQTKIKSSQKIVKQVYYEEENDNIKIPCRILPCYNSTTIGTFNALSDRYLVSEHPLMHAVYPPSRLHCQALQLINPLLKNPSQFIETTYLINKQGFLRYALIGY